jgi:hypothetical protein
MGAVTRPAHVSTPGNGVLTFKADGRTWRLCASTNALCELESLVTDPEQIALLMSAGDANFSTVRSAFLAFLGDHHPELTDTDAGLLLDHLGAARAGAKIAQALMIAFPEADPARPRKAARARAVAGIGTPSSANGSKPDSSPTAFGDRLRAAWKSLFGR